MNGTSQQQDTSDADEAAQFFGIVRTSKPKPPPTCAVWPANWDAVALFLGMQSQWERAGMDGTMTGLNYGRLPVVAAGLGIRWRPQFERLQIMEYEALRELAKRRPTPTPAQS